MRRCLSANALKLIAIGAMTADHLVWTLVPGYSCVWWVLLVHFAGRVTAPIMWFFIAEGYHHTRSVKKYALRLFGLAFVSHFAYLFCFGIPLVPKSVFNGTGVVWSLAWGLVLLWVNDQERIRPWVKMLLILFVCLITFPADWSCVAAMAVLFIGSNRGNFRAQMVWMMVWTLVYALVYLFFIDPVYGLLQLGTCLSIPLLGCYNGTRGTWRGMGKLFYLYYPSHLAALGLLRVLLWGLEFSTAAGNIA